MTPLSWGRRPALGRGSDVRAWALLSVVIALAALASGPAAAFDPRPKLIIGPETLGEVQAFLDLHEASIERQDLFAYERTLDRRSDAFVRCMRERFDEGPERLAALAPFRVLSVAQVSADSTLVRARVEHRGGIASVYVRRLLYTTMLSRPPFDIRSTFHVWYVSPLDDGEARKEARANAEPPLDPCYIGLTSWK